LKQQLEFGTVLVFDIQLGGEVLRRKIIAFAIRSIDPALPYLQKLCVHLYSYWKLNEVYNAKATLSIAIIFWRA